MEPLKNMFSRSALEPFVREVQAVQPTFPADQFYQLTFDAQWESLELKQRIRHISVCLRAVLPAEYREAVAILVRVTERLLAAKGENMSFVYMFLPDFVETHGLDDPDASIPALETMTRWSSAEFAVRPFLNRYPERMYAQMLQWSSHESPMVRRLSTEGIRPRLPWGLGVPALKKSPDPVLPILEKLKNDPAETVRRSVANNLNDISKDHPELALQIAARWVGKSPETDWIVKHACRGLLKKGNSTALALFGFESGVDNIHVEQLRVPASVPIGGRLDFSFVVRNGGDAQVPVRLEYGIDYITSTGKTSVKVFKIKEFSLAAQTTVAIEKYQRFQDFTTRKHFEGAHTLKIIVNGAVLAQEAFEVVPG